MLQAIKIYTVDLEVGMFVSALDRPWLETPFMIQGFRITDREQIDKLRKGVDFVVATPGLLDQIAQLHPLRFPLRSLSGIYPYGACRRSCSSIFA